MVQKGFWSVQKKFWIVYFKKNWKQARVHGWHGWLGLHPHGDLHWYCYLFILFFFSILHNGKFSHLETKLIQILPPKKLPFMGCREKNIFLTKPRTPIKDAKMFQQYVETTELKKREKELNHNKKQQPNNVMLNRAKSKEVFQFHRVPLDRLKRSPDLVFWASPPPDLAAQDPLQAGRAPARSDPTFFSSTFLNNWASFFQMVRNEQEIANIHQQKYPSFPHRFITTNNISPWGPRGRRRSVLLVWRRQKKGMASESQHQPAYESSLVQSTFDSQFLPEAATNNDIYKIDDR